MDNREDVNTKGSDDAFCERVARYLDGQVDEDKFAHLRKNLPAIGKSGRY